MTGLKMQGYPGKYLVSYVTQIKPSQSQKTSSKCRFVFVKQVFYCKNMPDVKFLTSEQVLTTQKEQEKKSIINMPQKYLQESYCKIVFFHFHQNIFSLYIWAGQSSTLCSLVQHATDLSQALQYSPENCFFSISNTSEKGSALSQLKKMYYVILLCMLCTY